MKNKILLGLLDPSDEDIISGSTNHPDRVIFPKTRIHRVKAADSDHHAVRMHAFVRPCTTPHQIPK